MWRAYLTEDLCIQEGAYGKEAYENRDFPARGTSGQI